MMLIIVDDQMRLDQIRRRYTIVLYHNGYPAEDIIKFDKPHDVDEWLISNFSPERRYGVRVDSPNEPTYYLTEKATTVAGRDYRPRHER
jgi:hypothetical protein